VEELKPKKEESRNNKTKGYIYTRQMIIPFTDSIEEIYFFILPPRLWIREFGEKRSSKNIFL
jgi:hypothetical protein